MPQLLSFAEALTRTDASKPRHVLLGNGFSRACRNDIFAYGALFERAEFESLSPRVGQAFEKLKTTDFEVVIRALLTTSDLIGVYEPTRLDLAQLMREDASALREVLVRTIARSHPEYPAQITPGAYESCRHFLANFDDMYSLNYDLLLYWALMHKDDSDVDIRCDDGFRSPDDPATDYVTWEVENTNRQNVFFLHGALHIFDAGDELKKYTWTRTGVRLIEQVRSALSAHLYPLFVAEGHSERKRDRIRHSDFLSRAYRSFANIGCALFVHGHSLAANDDHILRLIERGKTTQLFISIYGDPDAASNQWIMRRAAKIVDARSLRRPLKLEFYDAESAHVWG
jgi:hypothetical protein